MCKKLSPKLMLARIFSQQYKSFVSLLAPKEQSFSFFSDFAGLFFSKETTLLSPSFPLPLLLILLVMGVRRRRLLGVLIFFFVAAIGMNTSSAFAGITQENEEDYFFSRKLPATEKWMQTAAGRHLIGPGSSPPTCRSRCGRCFPCRPIHVAIQPGRIVPLEYYPEAWRCKCGNTLFMP